MTMFGQKYEHVSVDSNRRNRRHRNTTPLHYETTIKTKSVVVKLELNSSMFTLTGMHGNLNLKCITLNSCEKLQISCDLLVSLLRVQHRWSSGQMTCPT